MNYKDALYQAGKYAGAAFFGTLGGSAVAQGATDEKTLVAALVGAGIAAGISFFAHLNGNSTTVGTVPSVQPA